MRNSAVKIQEGNFVVGFIKITLSTKLWDLVQADREGCPFDLLSEKAFVYQKKEYCGDQW